jgi:hypothetical protein
MSKWIGVKVPRKLERCRETGVETQASARHLRESLADSVDLGAHSFVFVSAEESREYRVDKKV